MRTSSPHSHRLSTSQRDSSPAERPVRSRHPRRQRQRVMLSRSKAMGVTILIICLLIIVFCLLLNSCVHAVGKQDSANSEQTEAQLDVSNDTDEAETATDNDTTKALADSDSSDSSDNSDDTSDSKNETPASTPKDEWQQGKMPYLYQIDPQWSETSYSNGQFAKQGCGPTALSMVYIDLTGKTDMDPAEMAAFSTKNGYSTNKNGSSWALMSDGARKLGLTSKTLSSAPSRLKKELQADHPLICVMKPGTFTKVGHYLAIEGLDSDGKAIVHDSNSEERSSQTWDLSLICNEAVNVWSFSAA